MPETTGTVDTTSVAADAEGDLRRKATAAVERMIHLATGGEWLQVQRIAATLVPLLEELAKSRRHDALVAANAGIEHVSRLASHARNQVGEQLTAVRQGRNATQTYRQTGAYRVAR